VGNPNYYALDNVRETTNEFGWISYMSECTEPLNHADKGYLFRPRGFTESSTWRLGKTIGPHVIMIVDWLQEKAKHSPDHYYCHIRKREVELARGDLLVTWKEIADGCFCSRKQVACAIRNLDKNGFLLNLTPKTVEAANVYHHLRLRKYNGYQDVESYLGQRTANGRPTDGQPIYKKECKKGNEVSSASGEAVPTNLEKGKAQKGTRLDRNMVLPEEWRVAAKKIGLNGNIDQVFEEFKDYWCDVPGYRGVKIDWLGTWRNNCRKVFAWQSNKRPELSLRQPCPTCGDHVYFETVQEGNRTLRQKGICPTCKVER
jgi:hypothetical protein